MAPYLGGYFNNKLDWTRNTEAIYKKGQRRLFFLRRLGSFNVCWGCSTSLLWPVRSSPLSHTGAVGWRSQITTDWTNWSEGPVMSWGRSLFTLTTVAERRMLSKLQSILDNVTHPLYDTLAQQMSTFSRILLSPRCTTEHHRKSFLPVVIKIYKASLSKSNTPPSVTWLKHGQSFLFLHISHII